MRRFLFALTTTQLLLSTTALAQEPFSAPQRKPLEARVEANVRAGTERSIGMTEFWVPFTQDAYDPNVLYGDVRLMGDDQDNREFNIGTGYRFLTEAPLLGKGVMGLHGWFDRRLTERGSAFHQITAGAEWFGDIWDLKANFYLPLSDEKRYGGPETSSDPFLFGTGIYYDITDSEIIEDPQKGFDLEIGWNIPFLKNATDSTRFYAGGYHFEGDKSENVTGWRARLASDVTSDIQIGARFQRDDERGSQGFLEATIRFPFGNKKSYRNEGLYARLDESPERDIDIVTGVKQQGAGTRRETVINAESGMAQRVLYVDNSALPGGDGSLKTPFSTLTAAQAVLADNDIIYINRGDSTTTGMDQGLFIARNNVKIIGSGSDFVYDGSKFTTRAGNKFSGIVLKESGIAPVIPTPARAEAA